MAKKSDSLTELELQIMNVVWAQNGPVNIAQVQDLLAPGKVLAYTSVATMMNVLVRKGLLRRSKLGREYAYIPIQSKDTMQRSMLRDFVDRLFAGDPAQLVNSLLNSRKLKAGELDELSRRIDEHRRGEGGK